MSNRKKMRIFGLCMAMLFLACAEATRDRDAPLSPQEADSLMREIDRYDEILKSDTTSNQPGSQVLIAIRETNEMDSHPHLGSVLRECYQLLSVAESARKDCSDCTSKDSRTGFEPDGTMVRVLPSVQRIGKQPPACSCQPWGTCSNLECSCDQLCPSNFSIFAKQDEKIENPDHQLAFSLSDSVFTAAEVPASGGYCWGHAVVTQRFFRQAMYAPDEKPLFDRNMQQPQWIEYYRQIIQDIVGRNMPRKIPGFKNLSELSSDPLLKQLFARFVANQWGKEAASFDGLKSVVLSFGKSSERDITEFINEIESRISLGLNPVILQTPKEASASLLGIDLIRKGAHVTVATRVERRGYRVKVCLMDANHSAEDNRDCKSYLEINTKQGLSKHCEIEGYSEPSCEPMLGLAIPESEDRAVCLQFVRRWRSCNQKYDCHRAK